MARANAPDPFVDVTYVRCRLTKGESLQVSVQAAEAGMTREAWFRRAVLRSLEEPLQAHSTPIAPEDDPSMAIVNEILNDQATKMKIR